MTGPGHRKRIKIEELYARAEQLGPCKLCGAAGYMPTLLKKNVVVTGCTNPKCKNFGCTTVRIEDWGDK